MPIPSRIRLKAGYELTRSKVSRRLDEGEGRFASNAGAEIMLAIQTLAGELPCPLIIYNTEQEMFPGDVEWDAEGNPSSFLRRTQVRLVNGFLRITTPDLCARIPHIPLSNEEVMERIRYKYEQDEAQGLRLLSDQGSISCTLFSEWRLSRAVIKCTLQEICYDRRLQVTLASILVGTRFKCYEKRAGWGKPPSTNRAPNLR